MSETLSAEQPYTHDELEHLAENMRHPTVQRIVAPAEQKTINRLLATIEALQAELQEQRRVVKAAEVIIANADGHPAMCCGKCSSAIAKAEAEVTRLRERLWHHHQADGLETDPHHCRYCQEAGGTTWT